MNASTGEPPGVECDRDLARLPFLIAITIRVAGLAGVAAAMPFVWAAYRRPMAAVALAAVLMLGTALVVVLWRWAGDISAGLAFDVPFGAVALLIGAALSRGTPPGWTYFVFPYSVLIVITLGMGCRRLVTAMLMGLMWSAVYVLAVLWFRDAELGLALSNVPSYVGNAALGWLIIRLLRRVEGELHEVRAQELAVAGELAARQERLRHSRVLHDRVLQTLETLAHRDLIEDADQREHIRAQAAWLRGFVETGVRGTPGS
ncbi:hypothetical protein AB0392_14705 [Nonomuraea angiospora]|uniref:hypothetical protein n=1 Tax=Nonomuraea angiospora TaxID=46172 RepID=UPI00344E5B28